MLRPHGPRTERWRDTLALALPLVLLSCLSHAAAWRHLSTFEHLTQLGDQFRQFDAGAGWTLEVMRRGGGASGGGWLYARLHWLIRALGAGLSGTSLLHALLDAAGLLLWCRVVPRWWPRAAALGGGLLLSLYPPVRLSLAENSAFVALLLTPAALCWLELAGRGATSGATSATTTSPTGTTAAAAPSATANTGAGAGPMSRSGAGPASRSLWIWWAAGTLLLAGAVNTSLVATLTVPAALLAYARCRTLPRWARWAPLAALVVGLAPMASELGFEVVDVATELRMGVLEGDASGGPPGNALSLLWRGLPDRWLLLALPALLWRRRQLGQAAPPWSDGALLLAVSVLLPIGLLEDWHPCENYHFAAWSPARALLGGWLLSLLLEFARGRASAARITRWIAPRRLVWLFGAVTAGAVLWQGLVLAGSAPGLPLDRARQAAINRADEPGCRAAAVAPFFELLAARGLLPAEDQPVFFHGAYANCLTGAWTWRRPDASTDAEEHHLLLLENAPWSGDGQTAFGAVEEIEFDVEHETPGRWSLTLPDPGEDWLYIEIEPILDADLRLVEGDRSVWQMAQWWPSAASLADGCTESRPWIIVTRHPDAPPAPLRLVWHDETDPSRPREVERVLRLPHPDRRVVDLPRLRSQR